LLLRETKVAQRKAEVEIVILNLFTILNYNNYFAFPKTRIKLRSFLQKSKIEIYFNQMTEI